MQCVSKPCPQSVRADPSIPQDRVRKRIEAFFHESGTVFFAKFRCRSVAAAGDLLFFASPKKSKQKKGDPTVCVPPLRCGQPAVLAFGWVWPNSPAAQTVPSPDPPKAPLLSADRRGWGPNSREKASSNSSFINAVAIQIKGQTSPGFAEVL